MTIRNQNFKIYQGNSALVFVALTQSDGSPYDPSLDVNMEWNVARTSSSDENDFLLRKRTGAGIESADGGINITLQTADTDLDPGLYYHELKISDGDDVTTAMTGLVIVKSSLRPTDLPEMNKVIGTLVGHAPDVVNG